MINKELSIDTITFGKYKGKSIDIMLKDRTYCNWIIQEEWFEKNYEYLYNKVINYKPLKYFLKEQSNTGFFINDYKYFNLKSLDEIELVLTSNEIICYKFYIEIINELKNKINDRIKNNKDNYFDIKAPTKWLKRFEDEYGLKREIFKEFINTYELPNITYIIEDIKKEGGIEYKGAKSYIIAKNNSEKQEKYWENLLKNKYGDKIGIQYKYEKCIFDFINIEKNILYECKISLKDYNESQHNKYLLTLNKYKIIYLISNDCIINIEEKTIYTTNQSFYIIYLCNIPLLQNPTKLDELILNYSVVEVNNLLEII